MKQLLIVLFVVTMVSCSTDDTTNNANTALQLDEVPGPIKDYMNEHFASKEFISGYKKIINNKITYDITLSDNVAINFDNLYKVIYVATPQGLPDSAIPQSIIDYVAANYPNNIIVDWDLEDDYQEVELDNGLELEFTLDGVFVRIDTDEDDDEEDDIILSGASIPAAITTYLNTHFPGIDVLKVVQENDDDVVEYEVYLVGNIELEFNATFQITSISSEGQLPTSVVPQAILSYVTLNYPNDVIVEWDIEDTYQEIELNSGVELKFSLDGTFISMSQDDADDNETVIAVSELPAMIQGFVTTHFPSQTIINAYQKIKNNVVTYKLKLGANNIELKFNSSYENIKMESDVALPLSALPAAIVTYTAANYVNNFIVEYELKSTYQEVELNTGTELKFDVNGGFLSAED